jgi:hypothetical protein
VVLLQSFPFLRCTSSSVGPNSLSIRAMSSKRKEYKDARAKKAALFFLAWPGCEPNPVTRLSIPATMRGKGYSDSEAAIESSSSRCALSPKKINPMILLVPSLRPRHLYWPWRRLHQRRAAGRRFELSHLAPQTSAVEDDGQMPDEGDRRTTTAPARRW